MDELSQTNEAVNTNLQSFYQSDFNLFILCPFDIKLSENT